MTGDDTRAAVTAHHERWAAAGGDETDAESVALLCNAAFEGEWHEAADLPRLIDRGLGDGLEPSIDLDFMGVEGGDAVWTGMEPHDWLPADDLLSALHALATAGVPVRPAASTAGAGVALPGPPPPSGAECAALAEWMDAVRPAEPDPRHPANGRPNRLDASRPWNPLEFAYLDLRAPGVPDCAEVAALRARVAELEARLSDPCPKCGGSGYVHHQHPMKPAGVVIAILPCDRDDCVRGALARAEARCARLRAVALAAEMMAEAMSRVSWGDRGEAAMDAYDIASAALQPGDVAGDVAARAAEGSD